MTLQLWIPLPPAVHLFVSFPTATLSSNENTPFTYIIKARSIKWSGLRWCVLKKTFWGMLSSFYIIYQHPTRIDYNSGYSRTVTFGPLLFSALAPSFHLHTLVAPLNGVLSPHFKCTPDSPESHFKLLVTVCFRRSTLNSTICFPLLPMRQNIVHHLCSTKHRLF